MNLAFRHERQFIKVLHTLFSENGYEIRLVGGAVRDILQNKFPKDLDFCTNATPEQMLALEGKGGWKVFPTGIDHGTVTFMSLWGSFEVTTLRKDVECDGRHAKVEFTDSWEEDAARRDFTVNAMSMDVDGNVYDYFNGQEDLKNCKVAWVGEAEKRIEEDALRIIRFFRFMCRFEYEKLQFDAESIDAIIKTRHLLKNISVERIWQEYKKVAQNNPENLWFFFSQLYITGVQKIVGFPRLGTRYVTFLGRLKDYLPYFPETGIAVQLKDETEANDFADRFKLSNPEREKLVFFVNNKDHDFYEFGFRQAEDMINDGVDRKRVKVIASLVNNGDLEDGIDSIKKTDFPVSGQDLLDAGHNPGPHIGYKLKELREAWKESRYVLTKDQLLDMLHSVTTYGGKS